MANYVQKSSKRRGGQVYFIDGWQYRSNKRGVSGLSLVCVHKHQGCGGTARLDFDTNSITHRRAHNGHARDDANAQRQLETNVDDFKVGKIDNKIGK